MSKYRIMLIAIIPSLLLMATLNQAGAVTGNLPAVTAPSRVKMLKVTGVVKKIQNNILYLENNKGYNLSNVKITEAYDRNSRISEKKRMAEMLFINGTLKEVTIR
jgi:hypothetical protein